MFDPNSAAASGSGIFGLPYTYEDSSLIFLPVPWEVTTPYRKGTAKGPAAIFNASHQVDLFDFHIDKPYEAGFHFLTESKKVKSWNQKARVNAEKIIRAGGEIKSQALKKTLNEVNAVSNQLNEYVYEETLKILSDGKIPAVIGGDHSVPFGAIKALAEKKSFGILHFDAHSDTRRAYEGFTHSHASIMYNVLTQIPNVTKLVQVGIRDFCEEEILFCTSQKERVKIFYDAWFAEQKYSGKSFHETGNKIVAELPENVWVSFDIDGLDPRFCPSTGTPVPGGLDFNEANFLLDTLVKSGRKILGFDLNEVAKGKSDDWDGNVGARLLYKLSAWTLCSQGKASRR